MNDLIAWANNVNFIFGKTDANGNPIMPGFDLISKS